MTALACCKHALAKTATPVCLECYQDLLTVARQMREALSDLSDAGKDFRGREIMAHGNLEHRRGRPCKYCDLFVAFDTLVGEKP